MTKLPDVLRFAYLACLAELANATDQADMHLDAREIAALAAEIGLLGIGRVSA